MDGNGMGSVAAVVCDPAPVRAAVARALPDPLVAIVEARLSAWGREFSLRDAMGDPSSVSPLWVLLKFGGVSPRGAGGRPPLHVDSAAWEIERIVAAMYRIRPVDASVLRAYYGGSGRQKVERRALAEQLSGQRISERDYFKALDRGRSWILGALA